MNRKLTISDYYGRDQDIRDLTILDLYDGEPMAAHDVAVKMGTTKNAVIGLRNRIMKTHNAIECLCEKPENKDGGMKRGW